MLRSMNDINNDEGGDTPTQVQALYAFTRDLLTIIDSIEKHKEGDDAFDDQDSQRRGNCKSPVVPSPLSVTE